MAPVGPFAATVDAVYALVPDAERVTDPNVSDVPTPITVDTVTSWLTDVSAAVSVGIGPWGQITGPTGEAVAAAARTLVHTGAASYLAAARYGNEGSSYAAALWERYTAGLADLKARVTEVLDTGGGDVTPAGAAGPFGRFPAVYFGDGMQM